MTDEKDDKVIHRRYKLTAKSGDIEGSLKDVLHKINERDKIVSIQFPGEPERKVNVKTDLEKALDSASLDDALFAISVKHGVLIGVKKTKKSK